MRQTQPPPAAGAVPRWLLHLGGVALAAHLAVLVGLTLSVASGPWPSPFGDSMALAPQFAQFVRLYASPLYGKVFKIAPTEFAPRAHPAAIGAWVEIRLKDDAGKVVNTLRFPEEGANPWVRQRQVLLARGLTDDQPVTPRMGEAVGPTIGKTPTVTYWQRDAAGTLHLVAQLDHLVPRDQPLQKPSEWSLLLARSYARHATAVHGAAAAEVIRHTQFPIPPAVLFMPQPPPPQAFSELVSDFTEAKR
jgi:hypothetical protein